MSGLTEILLILLIVVVLFFLPRMVSRKATPARKPPPRPVMEKLTGGRRLAILASLVWLTVAALWLQPWAGNATMFAAIGVVPVVVGWGAWWVISGFNQKRS